MPLEFLRSRACAELSPHALKMLIDLCAGLGANASGNGDLSAAPAVMRPKGWSSDASRRAALLELEAADLIGITKRGNRRDCTLYAVTLWPLQCDLSKLEHGPAAFTTNDWIKCGIDRAERPSADAPATWKPLRKNENSAPATGQPPTDMSPQRDNPPTIPPVFEPTAGLKRRDSGVRVGPLRDTFLDKPSAFAMNTPTRMTALLFRARTRPVSTPLPAAYHAARACLNFPH